MGIFEERVRVLSRTTPLCLDLEWIGEGWDGDYQEEDPEDVPLMRFDLSIRPEGHAPEDVRDFEEVRDASYCTRIPATLPKERLEELARFLLEQFEVAYSGSEDYHPKRLAERLSWCDENMEVLA